MTSERELDSSQLLEEHSSDELRCRICYMQSKPLVALCECAGSIAYVHEQCIVDWISIKMSKSEGLLIPSCEICHSPYNARLEVGSRRLCFTTLKIRIALLKLSEKWLSLYYLAGLLLCAYLICSVVMQICWTVVGWIRQAEGEEWNGQLKEKPIQTVFTHLILTSCFLREALSFLQKLRNLIHQSYVQVVQLIIEPKRVIS